MFESLNAFVLSAIVILSGGVACFQIGKRLGIRPAMVAALFAWHMGLGLYYSSYVLQTGGDAFVYYQRARFDYVRPELGTDFVVWLSSFPVSLGFTYWPLALLYNVAGAIGLIFFFATLKEVAAPSRSLFTRMLLLVCAFIPSLSFWTSGIGKDAIASLSVGMFLWSTIEFGRRQVAAIAAVLIMLAVRPHVACLFVISAAVGTLFVGNVRGTIRFGIGAISTAAATFVVPLALLYSGSTQFSSMREFITDRQEQNMGGGSSVDIAGMNPMVRLLSFLYRPLPNEASGFAQLAASLDNLLLVGLTVVGILAVYRAGVVRTFRMYSIPFLYGFSCLVVLSQVTANLGLATRQKWMLVPALMMICVGAWAMAARKDAPPRRPQYGPRGATQALP
jgi:hypothetical protein